MTDYLHMNFETLGNVFRQRALGMRRLAGGILPGDFRSSLLALALDYDRQAEKVEQAEARKP
jgi:hypothetical protein